MLNHNLKTAARNLFKRKGYALLNISGLAIGLACCLIIALYVLDELHYDRFHENADRIYRLTTQAVVGENEWNAAIVSPAWTTVLPDEIPEIEQTVRVDQFDNVVIKNEDRVFSEDRVLAADGNFFEVFSFPLLEGNPETALGEPNTVVITAEVARKYFGEGAYPVGETLLIDDQSYRITGILAPVPANSHMHFDIAFSFNSLRKGRKPRWENTNTTIYVLLEEGQSPSGLSGKLSGLLEKHHPSYSDMKAAGVSWKIGIQALTDIHLYSQLEDELEPNGDIRNVYLFALIAFFILLLACINFINLTTARSADRALEVGVRKTLGSGRAGLIRQFLTETVLMTLVATVLAIGLAEVLRLPFNQLTGKALSIGLFSKPALLVSVLLIALLVSLLAGAYPALYLSRFQPVEVLRGTLKHGSKSSLFRNILVTFQFIISIGLIACTILVYQQLSFIQSKDLGLNKENVLVLNNADKLGQQQETFMEEVRDYNAVTSVSYSNLSPFDEYEGSYFQEKGKSEQERQLMNFQRVGYDYLQTLSIELKEGRSFSREIAGDTSAVMLNESAVKALGMNDPVGKIIQWGKPMTVIGVVKNYHFRSLHEKIQPLVLIPSRGGSVMEIRLQGEAVNTTLSWLQSRWEAYTANSAPFEYTFLDADFAALFEAEQQLGKLFGLFSALAIFIACLGLLGLAAFMAERRTKEIGIRKVMGASTPQILMLLSKEFTRMVLIAFILSTPVAYWLINRWLDDFAYRISIGWESFVIAGFVALLIAWLTVSFQSYRAAVTNPVEALRNE